MRIAHPRSLAIRFRNYISAVDWTPTDGLDLRASSGTTGTDEQDGLDDTRWTSGARGAGSSLAGGALPVALGIGDIGV